MKISIYIGYFNRSHIISNEALVPIQLGKANSSDDLEILGDDTGLNISAKNTFYCELTAQYWAWKNDTTSDYVGLMHYRRFLDFYPNAIRTVYESRVEEQSFTDDFIQKYGLQAENIQFTVKDYDMILPTPWNIKSSGAASVREQYKQSEHHHTKDLRAAEKTIRELSPEYLPFFYKVMGESQFCAANLFIFKRNPPGYLKYSLP